MAEKQCFKCGEVKSLSDFYKHRMMSDGHLNKCKSCAKRDVHENRLAKIEKYRAYDRQRGNRQTKKWRVQHRKKWPQAHRARNIVANAVRDKKLFREPCEVCAEKRAHAHHDDYARPLNVRWLCAVHHVEWHEKNGMGLNPK